LNAGINLRIVLEFDQESGLSYFSELKRRQNGSTKPRSGNHRFILSRYEENFTRLFPESDVLQHSGPNRSCAQSFPTVWRRSLTLATTYSTDAGYDLKIDRLEYYISEIELVHDGGQITPVANTWILVRPAEQSEFMLGVHNVQNLEAINFSVGVDSAVNHLDPASYAPDHPLSPQNPSMHWGWTAGYRFIALEGYAGPAMIFNYQIHALGNENYQDVSVQAGSSKSGDTLRVYVDADYEAMFKDMDVSGGVISHGAVGASVTLLNNMGNNVFFSWLRTLGYCFGTRI
jgi:hypothetical protein